MWCWEIQLARGLKIIDSVSLTLLSVVHWGGCWSCGDVPSQRSTKADYFTWAEPLLGPRFHCLSGEGGSARER